MRLVVRETESITVIAILCTLACMSMGDELVTETDLARTSDGGTYDNAWAAVREYCDVARYQAIHPDKGYTAIARQRRSNGRPTRSKRSAVAAPARSCPHPFVSFAHGYRPDSLIVIHLVGFVVSGRCDRFTTLARSIRAVCDTHCGWTVSRKRARATLSSVHGRRSISS